MSSVRSSFMALSDGNHKLPVKAEILRAIGKAPGQTVSSRSESTPLDSREE